MSISTQYEVPTWNQIYEMLLVQAQKIHNDNYKSDITVGISRGGIVSSRILADFLETEDFAIIAIEYYTGIARTSQEPVLKQGFYSQLTGKKVLLVDDVSDRGKSLQLPKKHFEQQNVKEIKIANIYSKPGTIAKPDYCEKETRHWIVFLGEGREMMREILLKTESKCAADKEIAKLVKAGLPKELAEKFLKDMQWKDSQ